MSLELWLKTLITISPQQECTNFEQHDATSLMDQLSSREAWVDRGHGLHIDLNITRCGQALPDVELRRLAKAILAAPAWKELSLQPSLPYDDNYEPGRLRITINHSTDRAASNTKPRHQTMPNIPAATLRPPEGVPVFCLDSVRLFIDIVEDPQRQRSARAKRVKTWAGNHVNQEPPGQIIQGPDHEDSGELLYQSGCSFPLPRASLPMKRSRPLDSPPWRTALSPHMSPEVPKDCQLTAELDSSSRATGIQMTTDITDLQTLIEGALRFSLYTNLNNKITPGVKVKANTFGPGLADIAPILWRPGYFSSLAQRAHLIPVISRSLANPVRSGKMTSMTLKQKLIALRPPMLPFQTTDRLQDLEPTSALDPEEMLEDSWQKNVKGQKSRPCVVGPDGSGAPNEDRVLQENPVTPIGCEDLFSEQHLVGIMAKPDHIIPVADDDLLLGDTFASP